MYKIVMIIAVTLLVLGWIAYGIWKIRDLKQQKEQPKQVSEQLQKTRKSFEDYAKKMEQYKKPEYKQE